MIAPWEKLYEAMKALALEEAQRADHYEQTLRVIAESGSGGMAAVAREALEK